MELAHFTMGEGPRRGVLLHGFLGQGRNLRSLAQRWTAADPSLCLLVPDLPGHGTSPVGSPTADLGAFAAAVLETCRGAGFEGPLAFTGHSLGGRVALAALRDAPEQVASITLLDIAAGTYEGGRGGTHRVAQLLAQAPDEAPDRAELREWLLAQRLSPGIADWLLMNLERTGSGVRWRIDRAWLLDFHARVATESFWDVLEKRAVPVRCIRGGASSFVSEEEVARFSALQIPVTSLPGAGHEVHVEALPALIEALTRPF